MEDMEDMEGMEGIEVRVDNIDNLLTNDSRIAKDEIRRRYHEIFPNGSETTTDEMRLALGIYSYKLEEMIGKIYRKFKHRGVRPRDGGRDTRHLGETNYDTTYWIYNQPMFEALNKRLHLPEVNSHQSDMDGQLLPKNNIEGLIEKTFRPWYYARLAGFTKVATYIDVVSDVAFTQYFDLDYDLRPYPLLTAVKSYIGARPAQEDDQEEEAQVIVDQNRATKVVNMISNIENALDIPEFRLYIDLPGVVYTQRAQLPTPNVFTTLMDSLANVWNKYMFVNYGQGFGYKENPLPDPPQLWHPDMDMEDQQIAQSQEAQRQEMRRERAQRQQRDQEAWFRRAEEQQRLAQEQLIPRHARDRAAIRHETRLRETPTFTAEELDAYHRSVIDMDMEIFDTIAREQVLIGDFIRSNPENVIIKILDPSGSGTVFTSSKEHIKAELPVYECKDADSMSVMYNYRLINLEPLGCPCQGVADYDTIQWLMEGPFQVLVLKHTDRKTSTLVSYQARHYTDYVGNFHCQTGTNQTYYATYVPSLPL